MHKAAELAAKEYHLAVKRTKKLKKLAKEGKSIVKDTTYYDERLENLEGHFKRWKEQYPEYFI